MDNEDILNLDDVDYMSGDELLDQNSDRDDDDEATAVEDSLMSTAENRVKKGGRRRTSKCWKHFSIIGDKYPDGSNDVQCKFCKRNYHFIRNSIKFVEVTESREKLFQSCVDMVVVDPKDKNKGLVMDVATRWNSTHLMLERAIIYKEAFRHLSEVEDAYQFFPSELEWERAESICQFLAPFAEMTKLVSGSSYPTSNLYFMQVWKIECWLRANEYTGDDVIREMVASMLLKFNKYWEEYSDILAIAAVLDPRLKFKCLEY